MPGLLRLLIIVLKTWPHLVPGPRGGYCRCSDQKNGRMHFDFGAIGTPKTHFVQNSGHVVLTSLCQMINNYRLTQ